MKLKFTVMSNSVGVVLPRRGTKHSAGFDIFCPTKGPHREEKYTLQPGESIIIPTGLRFVIPEGTYLEVKNRGSVAAKRGLICGACVIDSDYTGEVFINLINVSAECREVRGGEAIAQIIHKKYLHSELVLIEPDKYTKKTKRGSGALGSTNTK